MNTLQAPAQTSALTADQVTLSLDPATLETLTAAFEASAELAVGVMMVTDDLLAA